MPVSAFVFKGRLRSRVALLALSGCGWALLRQPDRGVREVGYSHGKLVSKGSLFACAPD